MKHIHIILLIFFSATVFSVQGQDLVWARDIDDSDTSHLYVYDNLTDKHGNTYMTGHFSSAIDFDAGHGTYILESSINHAAFVSKYDSSGKLQWARAIRSDSIITLGSGINAIAVDKEGSLYAVGYFVGTTDFDPGAGMHKISASSGRNMFIQKFDHAGNLRWVIHFPETNSITAKDIAVDANNNIYVTGTFGGTIDFDPSLQVHNMTVNGGLDIFVLKFSDSSFMWAKTMSGAASEYPTSISVDEEGSIYLTGRYYGTVDFDPAAAGVYNLSSKGYGDIFVARMDMHGNLVWARSFGDTGEDVGMAITCDDKGNTYTTGRFMKTTDFDPGPGVHALTSAGIYDAFILKLDGNGAYAWAKQIGGTESEIGDAVSLSDSYDLVYWTTSFRNSIDLVPGSGTFFKGAPGKSQYGFIILNAAGDFRWAMAQDNAISVDGNSNIAADASGYIYVIGRFSGTIDCDPGPNVYNISSQGVMHSQYILKFKPLPPVPSNIAHPLAESYSVYPNPTDRVINISAKEMIEKITITDITGKRVCDLQPGRQTAFLNIEQPGIYFVSITCGNTTRVEKIIVNPLR